MDPLPSVISADQVQALLVERACTSEQLLVGLIDEARHFSRPGISGYQVGAAGLGTSGAIYLGANIEFASCQLGQTIHAEQSVVTHAAIHLETGLTDLAVSAAPCGHCRQFLNELNNAESLTIYISGAEPAALGQFLPQAFGPQDLGLEAGLMGHPVLHLSAIVPTETDGEEAALEAAGRSYAPYTKALGGAALTTKEGAVFTGFYIENAAFNPSISPLQAAYVSYALSDQRTVALLHAVVAQPAQSKINHSAAAMLVCEELEPRISLNTIYFNDP